MRPARVDVPAPSPPRAPRYRLWTLILAALFLGSFALIAAAAAQARDPKVNVVTRNLYLGADLTGATQASSFAELVDEAGVILNQVDANEFQTRAKGLGAEIRKKDPDLVGLQEVALWRQRPCNLNVFPPQATNVRYDFLELLLNRLDSGQDRYSAVISQPEFDFEAPADTDQSDATGSFLGCEINGRLTMRDVILKRRGADVETRNARGGHFENQLVLNVAGIPIEVTRGWTRVNSRVGEGPRFRFVNTHLEAFDDGTLREQQAMELFAQGGPATGPKPVILLGDLNSDDDTVFGKDRLAYQALLDAGFRERSTDDPLSCCLNSPLLAVGQGGDVADFDHQVDHVMTDTPNRIKLLTSSVTGLQPVNGFWSSDHAGVFSKLRFR
jgi:endonuclease/exonuclease/phosphatase family metal-dependent hydrolase